MSTLQPYSGPSRKLVLAFDVGTTYSGIAYAILDPGQIPKIQGVTRFPGQENIGNSKIPSIMYYTQDGAVRAVGAEAALIDEYQAQDEGLIFIEWFKFHLRPSTLEMDDDLRSRTPALPANKTIVDVLSDFLHYLYACARTYIIETESSSGQRLWSNLQNDVEFVLSHPNGWEGNQQTKMRSAAVQGGLVPDTQTGYDRIHFVTEGEASMNFCVHNGRVTESSQSGDCILVIDAGGGTVDFSTYQFSQMAPLTIEEVTSPSCIMHGSTTINSRAEKFLEAKLRKSKYKDDIKGMIAEFEKSTKPLFKDPKDSVYIKFGSKTCTATSLNIRAGTLTLTGPEAAKFFDPAVSAITDAALKQRMEAPSPVKAVFLVGGFAASPYLYNQLQQTLQGVGLTLSRPDKQTSKAVAEGSVLHYLEHWVSARVALLTYGSPCAVLFDMSDPEHLKRSRTLIPHPSGLPMVPNHFGVILAKGTRFRENEEVSEEFSRTNFSIESLDTTVGRILCYKGSSKDPQWIDVDRDKYSLACTVRADTSHIERVQLQGRFGLYYVQKFKIILVCGLTELKAQIAWTENGVEKRGPANIFYLDDADESDSLY